MLGFFTLNCNDPCAGGGKDPIDYTLQLQSILESSRDILKEVRNHEVQADVDLDPIVSKMTQLLGAMDYVAQRQDLTTEQIRVSAESLQQKFATLASSIEGFESSTLLAFTSLGNAFKVESDETQAILNQLNTSIAESNKVTEVKYYQYILLAEATDVSATITIPACAIEIAAIPYTCYDYTVNGKHYTSGHQYMRESKSIGNRALVEDAHEIVIPPKAKLHLSYTSLRPIGEPTIVGGALSPTDDAAIAGLVDRAEAAMV